MIQIQQICELPYQEQHELTDKSCSQCREKKLTDRAYIVQLGRSRKLLCSSCFAEARSVFISNKKPEEKAADVWNAWTTSERVIATKVMMAFMESYESNEAVEEIALKEFDKARVKLESDLLIPDEILIGILVKLYDI